MYLFYVSMDLYIHYIALGAADHFSTGEIIFISIFIRIEIIRKEHESNNPSIKYRHMDTKLNKWYMHTLAVHSLSMQII